MRIPIGEFSCYQGYTVSWGFLVCLRVPVCARLSACLLRVCSGPHYDVMFSFRLPCCPQCTLTYSAGSRTLVSESAVIVVGVLSNVLIFGVIALITWLGGVSSLLLLFFATDLDVMESAFVFS